MYVNFVDTRNAVTTTPRRYAYRSTRYTAKWVNREYVIFAITQTNLSDVTEKPRFIDIAVF